MSAYFKDIATWLLHRRYPGFLLAGALLAVASWEIFWFSE